MTVPILTPGEPRTQASPSWALEYFPKVQQ